MKENLLYYETHEKDKFYPATTKMNMGKNVCSQRLASIFQYVIPRL